jgi:hypothetical protein
VSSRASKNDGDPVQFILSDNIARRQMSEGQCAIIFALAYPEPEKGGRGKSTNYSKLEWFSASRLSEARKIMKNSREMAKEVIAGTISFKEALDEATAVYRPAAPWHADNISDRRRLDCGLGSQAWHAPQRNGGGQTSF